MPDCSIQWNVTNVSFSDSVCEVRHLCFQEASNIFTCRPSSKQPAAISKPLKKQVSHMEIWHELYYFMGQCGVWCCHSNWVITTILSMINNWIFRLAAFSQIQHELASFVANLEKPKLSKKIWRSVHTGNDSSCFIKKTKFIAFQFD